MFTSALSSNRTGLSVLIVDDDPLLGELLGMQIEALGCRVAYVESAEQGLAALAGDTFNLLMTDWQMPGMDGMKFARAARSAVSRDGHLNIAMMTARGNEEVIRAAMESGVDDFLYKPVQAVEIELVIRSASRTRLLHHRLKRRNELLGIAHRRTRDALDRVNTDLVAATALHERLLPAFDRSGALALSHIYRPAALIGGDSIGATPLRDNDGLLFFLIDVCGHGVPAALDSFHLHHRIKQMRPMTAPDLAVAMRTINHEICERADDSYATVVCGLVFPSQREGWLICAGHPPPLLDIAGDAAVIAGGGGMPVGWFDHAQYEPVRFDFPVGARLLLYSDGLTEITDDAGVEYGLDGLGGLLGAVSGQPLAMLDAAIEEVLAARRRPHGFDDDISLLAIDHASMEPD